VHKPEQLAMVPGIKGTVESQDRWPSLRLKMPSHEILYIRRVSLRVVSVYRAANRLLRAGRSQRPKLYTDRYAKSDVPREMHPVGQGDQRLS
jgi:hypothetical protein